MRLIDFIVVHTAASYDAKRKRVVHQPVGTVRAIHVLPIERGGRGFDDIGYNRYIEVDGKIRLGRLDAVSGAHTEGLNARSLGVCCSGSGDHEPFNPAQLRSLVAQCAAWCRLYDLTADRVIGHREAPRFGAKPTQKTCPGTLIDMDAIRALVRDELAGASRGGVALEGLARGPTRDDEPKAGA